MGRRHLLSELFNRFLVASRLDEVLHLALKVTEVLGEGLNLASLEALVAVLAHVLNKRRGIFPNLGHILVLFVNFTTQVLDHFLRATRVTTRLDGLFLCGSDDLSCLIAHMRLLLVSSSLGIISGFIASRLKSGSCTRSRGSGSGTLSRGRLGSAGSATTAAATGSRSSRFGSTSTATGRASPVKGL